MDGWRVDKSGWPPGPWHVEPDALSYETRDGLPAVAIRTDVIGVWCGYVGVPLDHPWAQLPFRPPPQLPELAALYRDREPRREYPDASVHGGITFAGAATDPIALTVGELAACFYWVGFDCSHAWDVSPGLPALARLARIPSMEYRTLNFVRAEIDRLSEQAAAALGIRRLAGRFN